MAIDDKIKKLDEQWESEMNKPLQENVARSAVEVAVANTADLALGAVLHKMTFGVGAVISAFWTSAGIRRVEARAREMFTAMNEKIEELGEENSIRMHWVTKHS